MTLASKLSISQNLFTTQLSWQQLTQPASDRAAQVLLVSFLAFAGMAVLQPSDDLYRAFFYVGMLPATLWLLKKYSTCRPMLGSLPYLCAVVLLTLLLASVMWSDLAKPGQTFLRHGRWYLATIGFYTALCSYGFLGLHRSRLHGYILSFVVIAASIEAMSLYILQDRFPDRATGLGLLTDIINGVSILVVLWLLSLFGLDIRRRADFLLAAVALAAVAIFAVFNQSRGPLIILMAAAVVLLSTLAANWRRRLFLLVVLATALLLLYLWPHTGMLFESMIAKGDSMRVIIWKATLGELPQFWLHGMGVATDLKTTAVGQAIESQTGFWFNHPHNLFLSLWVAAGVLAPLLLGLLFVLIGYACLRCTAGERLLMLTLLMSVVGLSVTNPDRILVSPQEIYLFFWAPLGLITGRTLAARHAPA